MTEPANNNNSIAKAFGGVAAIVAVIAGVYAMVQPMSQRIDSSQDLVAAKFAEVKAQYDAQQKTIDAFIRWLEWWRENVPNIDATQDEKLRWIERELLEGR